MSTALYLFYASALVAGITHTLLGPDHYLPFVALAKARSWNLRKALGVTVACGLAHLASAVALAALATRFAGFLPRLELIEGLRGDAAAWALVAFGLSYGAWGLRKALGGSSGAREGAPRGDRLAQTVLFLVFAVGPCEPLIPLYMAGAAAGSPASALPATIVFGAATVATMAATVGLSLGAFGSLRVPARFARFSHALAGGVMGSCGLAMAAFGL